MVLNVIFAEPSSHAIPVDGCKTSQEDMQTPFHDHVLAISAPLLTLLVIIMWASCYLHYIYIQFSASYLVITEWHMHGAFCSYMYLGYSSAFVCSIAFFNISTYTYTQPPETPLCSRALGCYLHLPVWYHAW